MISYASSSILIDPDYVGWASLSRPADGRCAAGVRRRLDRLSFPQPPTPIPACHPPDARPIPLEPPEFFDTGSYPVVSRVLRA